MKRRVQKTTAIFKAIVTLNNGFHKTLRLSIDKVAKFVTAYRQKREFGLIKNQYVLFFIELGIDPYDIKGAKFINERTDEEFLTLA